MKMRQLRICLVCSFLCLCFYIRGSRFSIDPTSDQEMIFRINPDTGAITLGKNLDRETAGWHNITVKAVETGTPPSLLKPKGFMTAMTCSNKRIRNSVHAQSELRSVVSGDILYSCLYFCFPFVLFPALPSKNLEEVWKKMPRTEKMSKRFEINVDKLSVTVHLAAAISAFLLKRKLLQALTV